MDASGKDLKQALSSCLSGGNAVLLLPSGAERPLAWAAPWWRAGWKTIDCAGLEGLSAPFESGRTLLSVDGDWATGTADPLPALPVGRRHGRLRRSDFLAELAIELQAPGSEWPVLMAIRVDQASHLIAKLGQAAAFGLEQEIAARFAEVLEPGDAHTLWLEFGFGVLVQRQQREQVHALAERICASIAAAPFTVAGEPTSLTVSIGLALPPTGARDDGPDRWFASAHAAQAIALRHGGNGYDGVLSHDYDGIPAERVLIIREWAREATTGENIQVEFQPMQPLSQGSGGIYRLHAKLRDYRAPLGGVYRNEFLALAREAGSMWMIDRISLFEGLAALEQLRQHSPGTRILVPVEAESLDGAAWRWLEAELRRHPQVAGGLVLQLQGEPALAEPEGLAVLARARASGIAIALAGAGVESVADSIGSKIPADFICLSHQGIATMTESSIRELAASWQRLGRRLIVEDVDDLKSLPGLARVGVDYVRGKAVAGSSPRPDFEFMGQAPSGADLATAEGI